MERLNFLWLNYLFLYQGSTVVIQYHQKCSDFHLATSHARARKQPEMVVLEAEEQSSKGRGGQKLYRKGKQTGHREREQKQECQKKGVEEN